MSSFKKHSQCSWVYNNQYTIGVFNDKYYNDTIINIKLSSAIYIVSYNVKKHIKYKYVSLEDALKNFAIFEYSSANTITHIDNTEIYLETISYLFYESDIGHIIPNDKYIMLLYNGEYNIKDKICHDIKNDSLYFFYYPKKNIKLSELGQNDINWLNTIKSECNKFMKTIIGDTAKVIVSFVHNVYDILAFRIDMCFSMMHFSNIIKLLQLDLIISYLSIYGNYFFKNYNNPYLTIHGGENDNTIDTIYNYISNSTCDNIVIINNKVYDIRHNITDNIKNIDNFITPFYVKKFKHRYHDYYLLPIKSSMDIIDDLAQQNKIKILNNYKYHKIRLKIEPIIKIRDITMPLYACIHNKDTFHPYNIDYFCLGVICVYGINSNYTKILTKHNDFIKFAIEKNMILCRNNYVFSLSNIHMSLQNNFKHDEFIGFILFVDKSHIINHVDVIINYYLSGEVKYPIEIINNNPCIHKDNAKYIYNTFRELPFNILSGFNNMIEDIRNKIYPDISCSFHYPNAPSSLYAHLNIVSRSAIFNKSSELSLRFHDIYMYDSIESYVTNIDYYFILNMYKFLIKNGIDNILSIPLYLYYKQAYLDYYCTPQDKIKKYIAMIYDKQNHQ